mmetsp:Transcript_17471/g.27918  ORF Transcript_17471/g.27918 Transcript_17471/m.27918 type:complete len:97 (-) Transcript_17471:213-503(-)
MSEETSHFCATDVERLLKESTEIILQHPRKEEYFKILPRRSLDEQIKSSKKKEGTVQEKVQERTVHIGKDCRFQIFLKLSGGSEPSACFFNLFLRF